MTSRKPKIDIIEVYKTYLVRYGNNYDALVALGRDGIGPVFFTTNETTYQELCEKFNIDDDTLKKAHWIPIDEDSVK